MLSETDLRELLRGSADACFISGSDGLIRYLNPSAEALFGLRSNEAACRPCSAVFRGVDTDGRCVCTDACRVRQLASKKQPIGSFDMKVSTASGAPLWVNLSILECTAGSGETLLIHMCRDIDRRKRLEVVTEGFLAEIHSLTGLHVEDLKVEASPPHLALTTREYEVLHQIALGRSSKEIAHQLKISTATVRNHTQQVLYKLAVHSRTEAVRLATRDHLL